MVSAAGAVDEDELLRLAERRFGAAPAPAAPRRRSPAAFTGGCAKRTAPARAGASGLPAARRPASPIRTTGALRLFAEMLGGGMSSRLFQEARERLGLAYAIDAYADA